MKQLTKKQATEFYESKVWETWTDEQIVRLQLFQRLVCVKWSRFHEAIEIVLDRPVYTHEFAFDSELKKEYLGVKTKPTIEEIIDLIPEEKRIMINYRGNS